MSTREHNILTVDLAGATIVTGRSAPIWRFAVSSELASRAHAILNRGEEAIAIVAHGHTVVDVRPAK